MKLEQLTPAEVAMLLRLPPNTGSGWNFKQVCPGTSELLLSRCRARLYLLVGFKLVEKPIIMGWRRTKLGDELAAQGATTQPQPQPQQKETTSV